MYGDWGSDWHCCWEGGLPAKITRKAVEVHMIAKDVASGRGMPPFAGIVDSLCVKVKGESADEARRSAMDLRDEISRVTGVPIKIEALGNGILFVGCQSYVMRTVDGELKAPGLIAHSHSEKERKEVKTALEELVQSPGSGKGPTRMPPSLCRDKARFAWEACLKGRGHGSASKVTGRPSTAFGGGRASFGSSLQAQGAADAVCRMEVDEVAGATEVCTSGSKDGQSGRSIPSAVPPARRDDRDSALMVLDLGGDKPGRAEASRDAGPMSCRNKGCAGDSNDMAKFPPPDPADGEGSLPGVAPRL